MRVSRDATRQEALTNLTARFPDSSGSDGKNMAHGAVDLLTRKQGM